MRVDIIYLTWFVCRVYGRPIKVSIWALHFFPEC